MQEINVGLIGFGTVGSGLAQVLYEQAERIEKRMGAVVRLKTGRLTCPFPTPIIDVGISPTAHV